MSSDICMHAQSVTARISKNLVERSTSNDSHDPPRSAPRPPTTNCHLLSPSIGIIKHGGVMDLVSGTGM
ncbi:hypothetical protein BDZ97DRAFT_1811451, partial [Flammula alnicola]